MLNFGEWVLLSPAFGRKALRSTPSFATSWSMEYTGHKVETKADRWIVVICNITGIVNVVRVLRFSGVQPPAIAEVPPGEADSLPE